MNIADFDRAILLKWLHSGQREPFSESIYEAELTFTGRNLSSRADVVCVSGCHPTKEQVRSLAKLLVNNFQDGATGTTLAPWLDCLDCIEKLPGLSRWLVRVIVPWTD